MRSRSIYRCLLTALCFWPLLVRAAVPSVSMKLVNRAGAPVELFWMSLFKKGELIKQTTAPLRNGSETNVNTYETHEFQVKWLPGKGPAEDYAQFAHGKHDSTVTVLTDADGGLRVEFKDRFDETFESIDASVVKCLETLGANSSEFSSCVASTVVKEFDSLHTRVEQLRRYHTNVANRARNYTCADPLLETTEPSLNKTYEFGDKVMEVGVLLDTSHAKIMLIDDFISDEECQVLYDHGKPRLSRATVASPDGTSVVSQSRKAQQASYDGNVDLVSDPLHNLKKRVFDFAMRETGFPFNLKGQEEFTIIQYNPDDQYMPHCDGSCDGSEYNSGGRAATMVMYCQVPPRGGATSFSRSDIFVNPKKGQATFFSYLGPDNKVDDGLTEHSGCPVLEGEKWITTQWMRLGVDQSTPWSVFDPSGVRL